MVKNFKSMITQYTDFQDEAAAEQNSFWMLL